MRFEIELFADQGRFDGHCHVQLVAYNERINFNDALPANVVLGVQHLLEQAEPEATGHERAQLEALSKALADADH